MKFKIGDKVSVADDTIEGIIIYITNNIAVIEDINTGFEYEYTFDKLVKSVTLDLPNINTATRKSKEDLPSKTVSSKKKQNLRIMEINLHIECLLKNFKHLAAQQILTHQLDVAKQKIELLVDRKIDKLILIHGVGKGVLKHEIINLLKAYEYLTHREACFQTYGAGAIEIFY